MMSKRSTFWATFVGCCALAPGLAQAQFSQKAAAEAVFQEGAKLLAEGNTEAACQKFEASQELDPALGTTLRLADCYDRAGKTASAWAAFQEAVAMAQSQDQSERAQMAKERVEDLASRLSELVVELGAATRGTRGLEVRLNGEPLPLATLGTPIPVNPGLQHIEVQAPGYVAWSSEALVPAEPGRTAVLVPQLEPSPITRGDDEPSHPALVDRGAPADAVPGPSTESEGDTQRLLAYFGAAAGVATLAVGGYVGYRAYSLNEQSLDHCLSGEPNACTQQGKALRDDARRQGTTATVVASTGAMLVGAAVILLLTAPSSTQEDVPLRMSAHLTPQDGGIQLGGVW